MNCSLICAFCLGLLWNTAAPAAGGSDEPAVATHASSRVRADDSRSGETSDGAFAAADESEAVAHAAGAPEWMLRDDTGPSWRYGHALAYDGIGGVTVLFGGWDTTYNLETWEWDGSAWAFRTDAGPTARVGHAMAFDSTRGVTVLFAGNDAASSYLRDTWEWNGSTWARRSTTGPGARWEHALAYDSARGVTVLFGGMMVGSGYYGDTWEWNGSTWTLRTSTGPSPRYWHAMAYDVARGVTVLYGGYDESADLFKGDTWEWDGSTWTLRATTGPSARHHHAMAYDEARGVTVLLGGEDAGGYDDETWEWDGDDWTQSAAAPHPSVRRDSALAYDYLRAVIVIFGGGTGIPVLGDTWEYGLDCNGNDLPDADDIAGGTSVDCQTNGIPDECEPDCNSNGIADECDILSGTSLDADGNGTPDECEEPVPVILQSALPPNQGTLWRSAKNIIRLTFDRDLTAAPAAGQLVIQELLAGGGFGPDLSAGFTFSIDTNPKVLKIRETGASLTHRKWYAIRNGGGWPAADFEVQYVVLMGDVDDNGFVQNLDAGAIYPNVSPLPKPDDYRYDVDGNGYCQNLDAGSVFPKVSPLPKPTKPSGH